MPSLGVRLSQGDLLALASRQIELFEYWLPANQGTIDHLESDLDSAIAAIGGEAFVRLGSRSAKDSWAGVGPRVTNAQEALEVLLGCSERINDDLLLAQAHGYTPWIWVRKWMDIKPYQEFRCFVKDRHIQGVSQYHYHGHASDPAGVAGAYREIYDNAHALDKIIRAWLYREVLPFLRVSNAVLDVVAAIDPAKDPAPVFEHQGTVHPSLEGQVTLLEINPYFEMTDPCLFGWHDQEGIEGFRYIAGTGQVATIVGDKVYVR